MDDHVIDCCSLINLYAGCGGLTELRDFRRSWYVCDAVLNEGYQSTPTVAEDPYCLSLLKHYRSLMPMAMEARKPIFFLKSADGAIGAHIEAVRSCYKDFQKLAGKIAANTGIAFT